MKALCKLLAIFFLACSSAWAQAQPPSMYDPKLISYNATPFGTCTVDQVALNTTNGGFSSCNPLTHTWVGALSNSLPLSLNGGGFAHTLTGTLTAPRTWTLQDASDTFVFRSTTDTLANKSFSTAPLPSSAGGVALGSAALPFSNLFFGPSASASFNFGGTPTTQRTITWPDASDTVVELGATQALSNKTFDISLNTLKTATNTAGHYPRNNGTQYIDATIPAGDIPAGTSCGANNFATGINAGLAPACAQPAFSNLSGTASTSQIGTGTPAAGKYVDGGTGAWTTIPAAPTVTSINLAAATGNCSTQTFLTPGANALYRVGATVTITTNAGTSSTTPTIAVSYTDADSNTTVSTTAGTIVNSSGSNTVGPVSTLGPIYINAKAGTAITFTCSGYASSPVLTMAYTVHARLEGVF